MFEWYRRAEVCYAYLSDVSWKNSTRGSNEVDFKNSKWFTRGWTLQELLAPQWVEFYDKDWGEIGTKSSLADLITSTTGITHLFNFGEACIAQKMSWASRRETTRVEDQAYCLMGLFDVHMPPLYGEGKKAFLRLQLEILSKSDDESIFAWYDSSGNKSGLLAPSPERFRKSGNIKRGNFDAKRPPHVMTNQGLRLELFLTAAAEAEVQSTKLERLSTPFTAATPQVSNSFLSPSYLAPLNCVLVSTDGRHPYRDNLVALPLSKGVDINATRGWSRRGELQFVESSELRGLERAVIYTIFDPPAHSYGRPGTVLIRTPSAPEFPFSVSQQYEPGTGAYWTPNCEEGHMLKSFYREEELAALLFTSKRITKFALVIGSSGSVFWVDVQVVIGNISLESLVQNFVRSKDVRGGGERLSRDLRDGRVVSVSSKKQFQEGLYRYIVDLTVERKVV
jgi:hypothetical protein